MAIMNWNPSILKPKKEILIRQLKDMETGTLICSLDCFFRRFDAGQDGWICLMDWSTGMTVEREPYGLMRAGPDCLGHGKYVLMKKDDGSPLKETELPVAQDVTVEIKV